LTITIGEVLLRHSIISRFIEIRHKCGIEGHHGGFSLAVVQLNDYNHFRIDRDEFRFYFIFGRCRNQEGTIDSSGGFSRFLGTKKKKKKKKIDRISVELIPRSLIPYPYPLDIFQI
jgi:hypothetical protein